MRVHIGLSRAASMAALCISLFALPSHVRAQSTTTATPQLPPALDAAVNRLADSVRAAGVPRDPLVSKAAEGVLKGADDARILDVVRRFARELADARVALGSCATTPELVAAASALHAGVTTPLLARVQRAAGKCTTSERLVMPFVVLADMVSRHVTPDVAVSSLETLVERGAPDAQFANLRSAIERDIASGQTPDAAARVRSAAVLRTIDARPIKPPPPV